jgi:hypothetical protein
MEGQALFALEVLIREKASRCLLLTWSETKFNPTKYPYT